MRDQIGLSTLHFLQKWNAKLEEIRKRGRRASRRPLQNRQFNSTCDNRAITEPINYLTTCPSFDEAFQKGWVVLISFTMFLAFCTNLYDQQQLSHIPVKWCRKASKLCVNYLCCPPPSATLLERFKCL